MKIKLLYFVPLLALLTIMDTMAVAQPMVVNSRTRATSVPHGRDAIVRFFGNSGDMLVYNWDSHLKTNVFTCRVAPSNPTANRYVFPITSNFYGNIRYTIDDIVIVDMMCFFCGTKITPSVEYDISGNPYWVYSKQGFIGQMTLNQITNTPNGTVKYRIKEIPYTLELNRIDAIISPINPSDTLLGLVGNTTNGESCFLLINKKASRNGLTGEIYYASNSEEEFTDFAFCDPYFAIASRFPGEHWTFGMRAGEITQNYYYHDPTNDLFYLNKFNTSGTIDVLTNTNTTWHYDNVDIKLCHKQNNRVYLAYESFDGVPTGFPESQTSLFLMEVNATSDIQLITLQNVDSGVKDTGCFTDMVYVPGNSHVALLHKNTKSFSPWKSVMQMPIITGYPIMTVNTFASTDDETMTSLDVYNNYQVWAVGTRPSHNDSVALFYQNAAYTASSCYSQPNYHTAELESIEKADRYYSFLPHITIDIGPNPWNTVTSQSAEITQRCFTKETVLKDADRDDGYETDTETEQ